MKKARDKNSTNVATTPLWTELISKKIVLYAFVIVWWWRYAESFSFVEREKERNPSGVDDDDYLLCSREVPASLFSLPLSLSREPFSF